MYAAFCRPSILLHKMEKQTTRLLVTDYSYSKSKKPAFVFFVSKFMYSASALNSKKEREKLGCEHPRAEPLCPNLNPPLQGDKLVPAEEVGSDMHLKAPPPSNIKYSLMNGSKHAHSNAHVSQNELSSSLCLFTQTQWNTEKQRQTNQAWNVVVALQKH